MDIIDEMSMDPKEWELYESRRRAIMDYNTGIAEAKAEGLTQGLELGRIEGLSQGKELGAKENTIEIYPNPTDEDMLFIRYDEEHPITDYQICSSTGQVLQTSNESPLYKHINIENIPAGHYIIKFNVGSKVISKKFIKN